jgi:transcription elongation factor GreA
MSQRFPISPEGFKNMEQELHRLKTVDRPAIIAAIAEARAHGDLSENAEYSAAKEKQGFIETKIQDLESKVSRSQIIDIATITSTHLVQFGATVTMVDEESEEEVVYKIVSEYEANAEVKHISVLSPIARAILNKTLGESIEVHTPRGIRYYEIICVEFK